MGSSDSEYDLWVSSLSAMIFKFVKGIIAKLLFYLRSWFFDVRYKAIPRSELDNLLAVWKRSVLPSLKYISDLFDCDDYAEYMAVWLKMKTKTNGAGVALGSVEKGWASYGHAWVVAVVKDGSKIAIEFIEPQTGEYVTKDIGKSYKLEAVII